MQQQSSTWSQEQCMLLTALILYFFFLPACCIEKLFLKMPKMPNGIPIVTEIIQRGSMFLYSSESQDIGETG